MNYEQLTSSDFAEVPGMRGLRVARFRGNDGRSVEVIDASKDVVIPVLKHPSREEGRVLRGSVRFALDGTAQVFRAGSTWIVDAECAQGPHIVLEDDTRIVLVRDGKSALDGL